MPLQLTPTQYIPEIDRYLPVQNEQGFELSKVARFGEALRNAFCPTGKGGGIDPTCGTNEVRLPSRVTSSSFSGHDGDVWFADDSSDGAERFFAVLFENGPKSDPLGYAWAVKQGRDYWEVGSAISSVERQGIGTKVYKAILKKISPDWLQPDHHNVSEGAIRLHESLGRMKGVEQTRLNGVLRTRITPTKTKGKTRKRKIIKNAFCPTGKGGGIDPTCSPKISTGKGEILHAAIRDPKAKKWRLTNGKDAPAHIQKLGIPPAWQNVYVNLDPKGTVLARGEDAKSRTQTRYSASHSAKQSAAKFGRVRELRKKRSQILREVNQDRKDPKLRENAACLKLIMNTGIRPGGGDTKADFKSYGATTLEGRHVKIDKAGNVALEFVTGKNKGRSVTFEISDRGTASMLKQRAKKAGPDGKLFDTTAGSLSSYSRKKDGGSFKTKDFRTALGTDTAIKKIKSMPKPTTKKQYKKQVAEVGDAVAATLGNTRSVALKAYVDPVVFSRWRVD